MATGQAGRGEYLKGEPSDFLVKEILKRKEHILQFNPKKRADGASLRENACKEVTEVFNRKYPDLKKGWSQLKGHFDKRKDTLKKNLTLAMTYSNGTGGGRDKAAEAALAKVNNPSEVDGLLIDLIKSTKGALGVGDRELETGYNEEIMRDQYGFPMKDSNEYGSMEEGGGGKVQSAVSSRRSNPKPVTKKLSEAALLRAQSLSHTGWLAAAVSPMMERAARMGFAKKMNGGGAVQAVKVVKREENAGEEPAKKKKKGENGASCSKDSDTSMQIMKKQMAKGQAAIEAVEHLRAAIRYAPSLSKEDLVTIIKEYDDKVTASSKTD